MKTPSRLRTTHWAQDQLAERIDAAQRKIRNESLELSAVAGLLDMLGEQEAAAELETLRRSIDTLTVVLATLNSTL